MIVFLHGFASTPAAWPGAPATAPALAGHGAPPASCADEITRHAALLAPLAPVHLVGYSMGARLALGLLARDPAPFRAATLVGLQPGLTSPEERAARVTADERWARLLEDDGLAAFDAAWEAQPLFLDLTPEQHELRRRRRRGLDPRGLAAAIRDLGTGAMPELWPALPTLTLPVTFVAGARDEKFAALAARAAAAAPRATVRLLPGAGHDVLTERPGFFQEIT